MVRRRLTVLPDEVFPAYVVWELTLLCDQPCAHCGSRAGARREVELTTEKALAVVDELAALGAREVVLIGGEAYLHAGFLDVARKLAAKRIRVTMTTGGKGLSHEKGAALARAMREAGVSGVSVSVDGLEREHDTIRGAPGSHAAALAALDNLRAAGIPVAANTNVNRVNAPVLEQLFDVLAARGIGAWQVQITVPLGRAADRPQMLLQPWDLLDVLPRVGALKARAFERGILLMPGNNLGYFGPEEGLLRTPHAGGEPDHWQGCQAGKLVMGIESDGAVKGCPSLQSTHYVGGSLRERSLEALWSDTPQLAFNRARTVDDLWGFCRTCAYAEVCKGGCTFTAHAIFGRPGNNPFCHYRALTLAKEGKRERLVPGAPATGRPFDNGLFDVVVEPLDAPDPVRPTGDGLVAITRAPRAGTA